MTAPNTAAPPARPSAGFSGGLSRGLSIRISIASVVVFSMLLVAVVVLALGWAGARSTVLDVASRIATDSGLLVTERAKRMLEPAQSTLRQLSFDPITIDQTLPERLERLYVLSEELVSNALISAIYVGYADGQFLLVRPLDKPELRQRVGAPPKANFLVQSQAPDAQGRMLGEYLFFDTARRLLERRPMPEYRFDPRARGWYQEAMRSGQPAFSKPYAFFTTREVGVTLSQPSHAGNAVVGIDLVLDDLSQSLGDLRMSRNAQIALVNDRQEVLAYPDMQRVLTESQGNFEFVHLDQLGEDSLAALARLNPPQGEARFLMLGGKEVLGVVLPFDVWTSQHMRLLVTAPVDELLGDLPLKRRRITLLVLAMVGGMLLLSWPMAARIGQGIERLTRQAGAISRFKFSNAGPEASYIKEVNELGEVMQGMSRTIESFLLLSQNLAAEPQVEKMLDQVLAQLVLATRCRSGAVYLWDKASAHMVRAAVEGPDQDLFAEQLTYPLDGLHTAPPPGWQLARTELRGRQGSLQGLLVLLSPQDEMHADAAFDRFAHQLSGMLAVSIETRQLIEAQQVLLDAVVRLMADAIDAKSPYTGGHCERVPELATRLIDRLSAETQGPYADFRMSEDERHAFYLGAWLHDCGKVTSPEHIVDKATKLELIYNRIHEIRMRFEVLWRDAEIDHLRALASGADATEAEATLRQRQQQLQSDFAFVAQCNIGGEFMADEALRRLQALGTQTWMRHFDDRLGLSSEELRRLAEQPAPGQLPVAEPLLADRPEHLVPWDARRPAVEKDHPDNHHGFDMVLPPHKQNMGELHNLSVRRGTLTEEDRFRINEHIVQTYTMLKGLPWPEALRQVPEIAATHHERLDGKGYPRRLPAERLTVADRVMALADVFEALTAADRPYKAPKTLSESLRIMALMCRDQHLDTELFRYFLHSELWLQFGRQALLASQIDTVDVAALEALLPG